MFLLESYVKYEGREFHGVFDTKEKAKKAKEYLISIDYDTQKYIITKVTINKVFVLNLCV